MQRKQKPPSAQGWSGGGRLLVVAAGVIVLSALKGASMRIARLRLDASEGPADMDFPGLRSHPMKGDYKGFWAVDVSGNRRIVFRFEEQEPHDVDLVDYH